MGLAVLAVAPVAAEVRAASGLYGRLVFDGALLVVPDRRWTVAAPEGAWSFVLDATLACYLARPLDGPLEVALEPERGSPAPELAASWDGVPLAPSAWRRVDGVPVVTIEADRLAPGLHRLGVAARAPGALDPSLETRFRALRVRSAGGEVELAKVGLERSWRIADFLLRGVLGDRLERRAGTLAVGPGAWRPTRLGRPGTWMRVEPENLAASAATFTLRGAGPPVSVELEPRGRSLLRAPLDGDGGIALEVAGPADGLFLWSLPVLEGPEASPSSTSRPPVVLVTLDTTRRDVLGTYGGPAGLTPVLDRFAERATVFERAVTTAPWTLPAHASIFTGLFPSRHRAGVDEDQLWPEQPTLAGLLRDAGYVPAGFSSGQLSSSTFGLALGFATYRDPEGFETPGDRTSAAVDAWLAASPRPRPPAFLFVNLFDPHALYHAPPDLESRTGAPALRAALAGVPVWSEVARGDDEAWRRVLAGEAPSSPAAVAFVRAAYQAEVAHADRVLGRIFAALEARGLFEPALVVVTADHGELLGERGFFSHSARLDPEVVEVPLLIKWPGQRQGRRVEAPVSLVDLFPTVLAAAGVESPPSDGVPLGPAGPLASASRTVFYEEHEHRTHPLFGPMRIAAHVYGTERARSRAVLWEEGGDCARRGRRGGWEVAACPQARRPALDAILAAVGRVGNGAPAGDPRSLPEELRKALAALGYLGR